MAKESGNGNDGRSARHLIVLSSPVGQIDGTRSQLSACVTNAAEGSAADRALPKRNAVRAQNAAHPHARAAELQRSRRQREGEKAVAWKPTDSTSLVVVGWAGLRAPKTQPATQ